MTNNPKIYNLISLAMKAGKVKSGNYAVTEAVKKFEACLLLCAEDASDRSKKDYGDMCHFYETPFCLMGTREMLGRSIGKEDRVAVCITDEGFANSLIGLLLNDGLNVANINDLEERRN